ncbi:MAG: hypothetical protein OHK0029_19030 [Armatimonadaceae bacterium]
MSDLATIIRSLLEKERAAGFPSFAGTTLDMTVPVRERFINDLISAALKERPGPLEGVRVEFRSRGVIYVELDPRMILIPRLRMELKVQEVSALGDDPVLRIHILQKSGLLNLLLEAVPFIVRREGVYIGSNMITIDLSTVLAQQPVADFLPYVRRLTVTGEEKILYFQLHCAVPEE